jgi:CBS domain-containing protein
LIPTTDDDVWSAQTALRVKLEATPVSMVMSRSFPRASPQTSVSDLEWLFCHQDVCAVPVVGPSNMLLGVVTKSDLIRGRAEEQLTADESSPDLEAQLPGEEELSERIGLHVDADEAELLVADVMTPALVVAQQHMSIGYAMTLMVYEGVSSLPVVRRSERAGERPTDHVIGMVSTRDIVHWMVERAGYLGELAAGGLLYGEWNGVRPPPRPLPTCDACQVPCADC